MWLFPTVTELMSGELIAGAKALVTVLTGEWFLRLGNHLTETEQQLLVINSQVPARYHFKGFHLFSLASSSSQPLTNPVCLQR